MKEAGQQEMQQGGGSWTTGNAAWWRKLDSRKCSRVGEVGQQEMQQGGGSWITGNALGRFYSGTHFVFVSALLAFVCAESFMIIKDNCMLPHDWLVGIYGK